MDKVITGIIVVVVAVFFIWLYQTDGDMEQAQVADPTDSTTAEGTVESMSNGSWEAVVGTGEEAHVAGRYNSYTECYQGVGAKVDVNVTPYSCTNQ